MNKNLLLILALAFFLRLFTFAGYIATPDEIIVVDTVGQILQGSLPTYKNLILEMVFPTRIGFLGVLAGLVKLFGFSNFSVILYPFCCSLLTILLVYALGKRWINERGGLLAAFLYALFPLDILFSTKLYPETCLNFLCTLSVFLFVLAEEDRPEKKKCTFAFLAGLVIGFAYLHKVTAGYFCILFALIGTVNMFRKKKILMRYVFLFAGFLAVFCFELAFHSYLHNDPLYRWHVYSTQADSAELKISLAGEERTRWQDDFIRLFWTFPVRTLLSIRLGFSYWFIFPALFYCLLRKRKELWMPLLWWIIIAIFSNLSTFKGGRLPFYVRQTMLISVPGVLLLVATLSSMKDWTFLETRNARKILRVSFLVLTFFSVFGVLALFFDKENILSALADIYLMKSILPIDKSIVEWVLNLYLKYILIAGSVLSVMFVILFLIANRREKAKQTSWPARLLPLSVAGFLAVAAVSVTYSENRGFHNTENTEREASRVLRALPQKKIYTDWYTKQILDFFSNFKDTDRIGDLRNVRFDELHDVFLVYNRFHKMRSQHFIPVQEKLGSKEDSPFAHYYYTYEGVDEALSKDWKIVKTLNKGLLVIYYIP